MKIGNQKAVVIGLGRMGQNHLTALKELKIPVVGVWDLDQGWQREIETNLGLPPAPERIVENFLSRLRPDLLIIATTAPAHFSLAVTAAKIPIPFILCEKPITTSVSDAETLIATCETNGVLLGVNHQMRFLSQYSVVRDFIASGRIGNLRSMIVSASNFGLAMNGTHYVEAFNWITKSPLILTTGWLEAAMQSNPRGPQFLDHAGQIYSTNALGQRLIMDLGSDLGHGVVVTYNFEFGKMTVDELSGQVNVVGRKLDLLNESTQRYGLDSWTENFTVTPVETIQSTKKVIEALLLGNDFPDGGAGLRAITTIAAAIESSNSDSKSISHDSLTTKSTQHQWA